MTRFSHMSHAHQDRVHFCYRELSRAFNNRDNVTEQFNLLATLFTDGLKDACESERKRLFEDQERVIQQLELERDALRDRVSMLEAHAQSSLEKLMNGLPTAGSAQAAISLADALSYSAQTGGSMYQQNECKAHCSYCNEEHDSRVACPAQRVACKHPASSVARDRRYNPETQLHEWSQPYCGLCGEKVDDVKHLGRVLHINNVTSISQGERDDPHADLGYTKPERDV